MTAFFPIILPSSFDLAQLIKVEEKYYLFGNIVFEIITSSAAMSSSRSDVINQFARPFMFSCVPFFLLVSLESVVYLNCHKASKSVKGTQRQSRSVSMVFLAGFNVVYSSCKYLNYKFLKLFTLVSHQYNFEHYLKVIGVLFPFLL